MDGVPGRLTLSDPLATDTVLTIGGSAGNPSVLDMEVGNSSDDILISAGKLAVNAGGGQITIVPLPGLHTGIYDLLDFQPGQAMGLNGLSLTNTTLPGGYTLSLQATITTEELIVVPEPSAITLVSITACGLLSYGRLGRRRRTKATFPLSGQ